MLRRRNSLLIISAFAGVALALTVLWAPRALAACNPPLDISSCNNRVLTPCNPFGSPPCTSDSNNIATWIPYSSWPNPGTTGNTYYSSNWPTRSLSGYNPNMSGCSPNCAFGGSNNNIAPNGTSLKSLPYLAWFGDQGFFNFDASGDEASNASNLDGGTSTVPAWMGSGGLGGAWIGPYYQGSNWLTTTQSWSNALQVNANSYSAQNSCDNRGYGDTPPPAAVCPWVLGQAGVPGYSVTGPIIWGAQNGGNIDTTDHSNQLFTQNGWGNTNYHNGMQIESQGTTLFQNTFNLSSQNLALLQQFDPGNCNGGGSTPFYLNFSGISVPFLAVYLNGHYLTGSSELNVETVYSTNSQSNKTYYWPAPANCSIPASDLLSGTNILAIQAVSSASWTSARWPGCYSSQPSSAPLESSMMLCSPWAGLNYTLAIHGAPVILAPAVQAKPSQIHAGDTVSFPAQATISNMPNYSYFTFYYTHQYSEIINGVSHNVGSATKDSGVANYNQTQGLTAGSFSTAGLGLTPGNQVCDTVTILPQPADFRTTNPPNPATACATVVGPDQPYLSFYGGDVVAGSSKYGGSASGSTCTGAKTSGVYAYNQNNTPIWSGAGSQFAVRALGPINGFASGQGTSTGAAGDGLSFAHGASNTPTSNDYGGCFSVVPAMPNFGTAPSSATPISGSQSVSALNGTYNSSGNLTLTGGTLGTGKHVTIYVTGDVNITGDITYSGSWTSLTDIPAFEIIATGNINIIHSVANLYGTYAAPTGTVYTCSDGGGSGNAGFNTICNQHQLAVYGAFVANKVALERTYGDLNGSTDGSGQPVAPAEVFYYSPALWLNGLTAGITSGNVPYNSITSLPPVL